MIYNIFQVFLVGVLDITPTIISMYLLHNAQLDVTHTKKTMMKYFCIAFVVIFVEQLLEVGMIWNGIPKYLIMTFYFIVLGIVSVSYYWQILKKDFLKIVSVFCLSYFLLTTFGSITIAGTKWFFSLFDFYGGFAEPLYRTILVTIVAPLAILLIAIILAKIMRKLEFSKFVNQLFVNQQKNIFITITAIAFADIYALIPAFFPVLQENSFYPMISLTLLVLFFSIMFIITINQVNKEKLESQLIQIEQQNNYVTALENLQQEMRFIKHDFENIMAGLYLQANEGDISGVQGYLKKTLQYFDEKIGSELKMHTQLRNIEIMPLKSLLLTKEKELKQRNIDVRLEVFYPISKINMDYNDLLRCLGILIDNASEEAEKLANGYVNIILLNDANRVLIHIENPVQQAPILHKIYEKGYSSKGANRGLGLSSYRTILKQYPTVFSNTSCKNNVFTQKLEIKEAN